MKFSLVTLTTLVAAAAAAPSPLLGWADNKCGLSQSTAKGLVDGFGSLLTSFTKANAERFLSAATFTDVSSSINFLTGKPVDAVTFPSRDAFIAGQGAQPPIGFSVLGIDAVTCSASDSTKGVIAFRWKATVGRNVTGGSKGINVLYVTRAKGQQGVDGWVIETVYSEFNNANWAIEFGGTCAVPARPASLFA